MEVEHITTLAQLEEAEQDVKRLSKIVEAFQQHHRETCAILSEISKPHRTLPAKEHARIVASKFRLLENTCMGLLDAGHAKIEKEDGAGLKSGPESVG